MLYRRSMLVFLDDSGDPGFKVAKGSTPCFVIALVIFDDDLEAEKCAVAIKELRRTLGLSDNYEFRFNGSNRDIRLAFLRCAARLEFRVRAIVMDKARIYGAELRSSKDSFYRYAIKMVLQHNFGKIRNARLRLDGHGDREFRRELRSYLSREVRSRAGDPPVIAKLKMVDSKRDVLIQLADMVAGTLRRDAEGLKGDAGEYMAAIRSEAAQFVREDPLAHAGRSTTMKRSSRIGAIRGFTSSHFNCPLPQPGRTM